MGKMIAQFRDIGNIKNNHGSAIIITGNSWLWRRLIDINARPLAPH